MLRDDLIEYSLDAHHSEEEGKVIRKKIARVSLLLLVVTSIEVLLGIWWDSMNLPWALVKVSFIGMTLLKAAYIVLVFMHLKEERTSLKWAILAPYLLFISYLVFILLTEGISLFDNRFLFGWF